MNVTILCISLFLSLPAISLSQDLLVGNGLRLEEHKDGVNKIAPIPSENKLLLTGDWKGELCLWDMDQKRVIGKRTIRVGFIRGLEASKRGGLFVACTNTTIVIGKIKPFGFKHEIRIEEPQPVYCSDASISPDGSTVAALIPSQGVRFYATNSGKLLGTVALSTESNSLCYLPDGRIVTGGSADRLETIRGMQVDQPIPLVHPVGRVDCLSVSPDGSHIAALGQYQVSLIPLLSNAAPISISSSTGGIANIAWSYDSQAIITGCDSGQIDFYTLSGQTISRKILSKGQCNSLAMTSGGSWFIAGGGTFLDMNLTPPRRHTGDNSILVWPLTRKPLVASLQPSSTNQTLPPPGSLPATATTQTSTHEKGWSAPMLAAAQAYQLILEEAMQQATDKEDFAFALKLKQERDLVANGQPLAPSANAPANLRDARNLYIQEEQATRLGTAK